VIETLRERNDAGEFLVILEPLTAEEVQDRLRSSYRMTQVGSPCVSHPIHHPQGNRRHTAELSKGEEKHGW